MMEAVRTSETSVDNHFTRQYNPEDSSEHHTRRRENLKSHKLRFFLKQAEEKRYVKRNAREIPSPADRTEDVFKYAWTYKSFRRC
jgi:hypothetical protein